MNALTPQKAAGAPMSPAPTPEGSALVHMIERVARDPSIDLSRLETLMAMHERVTQRNAENAFNEAMARAQTEMRAVGADSDNPQTRSRYASYAALDRAVRPIYTRHGFALSFNTGTDAPENCVRVLCDVSNGGFTRRYHIDMPADGMGAKGGAVMTKTHAAGSAITYGMRYLLKMIFNVAVGERGDDDDGNSAGYEPITPEQAEQITKLVQESRCNIDVFLRLAGVESISDIRADKFSRAVAWLNQKKQAVQR